MKDVGMDLPGDDDGIETVEEEQQDGTDFDLMDDVEEYEDDDMTDEERVSTV